MCYIFNLEWVLMGYLKHGKWQKMFIEACQNSSSAGSKALLNDNALNSMGFKYFVFHCISFKSPE